MCADGPLRAGRGRGCGLSTGETMPKIVIAAGGTAGHVVPALAIAEALRARDAQIEFIGGERAEAGWCRPPAFRCTRCG